LKAKEIIDIWQYERGDVLTPHCPSRTVLKNVTSRWGVLVLFVLEDGGIYRYSNIRKQIVGISEKMLTQTLRQLEEHGLVTRKSLPVVPPHVEYQLTKLGLQAATKVKDLALWIEENIHAIVEAKQPRKTGK
jgi:DNA-binding HxlR family transcriptional regulator